jgi:F0F1-type ATP synthase assembly protein I
MGAPGSKGPETSGPGGWLGAAGPYLTMGMELAIAVVGMFFLGRWIDAAWETAPWGMFSGLTIGVVGGFVRFIRRALALGRAEDDVDGTKSGQR